MTDELLVAKKTFLTEVDGKRVRVIGGQTRVRAGHPLVQGREELFEPAEAQYEVEDTTARPGQKRGGRRRQDKPEEAASEPAAKKPEADKD